MKTLYLKGACALFFMRTILLFLLCLILFLPAVLAQSTFKVLYHEMGYTTASGVPLIFANKSDTSRKEIVSLCVNLVQSDSLAHIFYEHSGKCGEIYKDTSKAFGKKANHHDIFFDFSNNEGYEFRTMGLKKNQLKQFRRSDAEIVITKRNMNVSGMNCDQGYINTENGVVEIVFTNDDRYPRKSYYRGFVIPGLLVEMFWESRSIYAKMKTLQQGKFTIEIPRLKVIAAKAQP